MLKYPCLVLDHDDTVVQSEATINYPFFCQTLAHIRPGVSITLKEYTHGCYYMGFSEMCRKQFGFTQQEVDDEFAAWLSYARTHIPPAYPGMGEVIRRQKEAGGYVCVVSHSGTENILRDYRTHFGIQPDGVYSWDLPESRRKPSPYALLDIMERFHLPPSRMLVVDDMKPGWEMARKAGVNVGFARWGRKDFREICDEMERICDFSFDSPKKLETFLFAEVCAP